MYCNNICCVTCVENERMITILTTFQFSHFAFYSSLSTYAPEITWGQPDHLRQETQRKKIPHQFLFAVWSPSKVEIEN